MGKNYFIRVLFKISTITFSVLPMCGVIRLAIIEINIFINILIMIIIILHFPYGYVNY